MIVYVMGKNIMVASSSKSRRELATENRLDWLFVPNNFDEDAVKKQYVIKTFNDALNYVKKLSYGKALSVAKKYSGIIIGCDSVAFLGGYILEKPKNKADFERMMNLISTKPHHLITGVSMIDTNSNRVVQFTCVTKLYFDKFTNEQKEFLFNQKNGLNNAGGYTLCNEIEDKTHIIKGDRNNVIGLPIKRILEELKNFN